CAGVRVDRGSSSRCPRRGRLRSEIAVFTLKRSIGLLLDDARSGRKIDRLLEPRALVVEPVDHARELDEELAKVRPRLAVGDGILYVPQLCIHPFEFGAELVEHRALYPPQSSGAQRLELAQDVLELARVLDALGLYFEDGDLVHQLADRDGHQDVLWWDVAGS